MKPRIIGANRTSTLVVLAIFLVVSGFLRLGAGASPELVRAAFAQEDVDTNTAEMTADKESMSDDSAPDTPSAKSLQMLMDELAARESRLRAEEERILVRTRALEVAKQAIDKKLVALTEAEERLRETIALADGAAEGDLTQLTSVYERMKPKEAAALFETMDPQFSAGFLGRMKPEVAAAILAKLTPQVAYSISVILAGRNTEVPTE